MADRKLLDLRLAREAGDRGGTSGYFSWHRLEEILTAAGELKRGERLYSAEVTPTGVRYTVVSKVPWKEGGR